MARMTKVDCIHQTVLVLSLGIAPHVLAWAWRLKVDAPSLLALVLNPSIRQGLKALTKASVTYDNWTARCCQ